MYDSKRKMNFASPYTSSTSTTTSNSFNLNNFSKTPSLETILKNNDITPEIQKHLSLVYSSLICCMLASIFGASFNIAFGIGGGLLSFIASIGIIIWIHVDAEKENFYKRLSMLCGFGFVQGMGIGPIINTAIKIDPSIIILALFCTGLIFGSFSVAAMISSRRSYMYLGGEIYSSTHSLTLHTHTFIH